MIIHPTKRAAFHEALIKASQTAQMLQSELDEAAKLAIGGGTNLEHQMLLQTALRQELAALRKQWRDATIAKFHEMKFSEPQTKAKTR